MADQGIARPGQSSNAAEAETVDAEEPTRRLFRRRPRWWHRLSSSLSAGFNRPGLWEALRYAGLVFVCVRLGTFILGLLAAGLLPPRTYVDVPNRMVPRGGGWDAVFTAWERQDALWYLRIADLGYNPQDGSAAFFPLFPALVRGVGAVLRDDGLLLSGLVVSNLSFFAALIVVYLLTKQEFDTGMARRTILYLAIFPYGLFFMAPYTESLFLLLSTTAIWAIRNERWLTAGSIGALAALTRSTGILLAAIVLLGGILAVRRTRSWRPLAGSLIAAVVVTVGLAVYFGYWQIRFGDAARPIEVHELWEREARLPWETLATALVEAVESPGRFHGGYAQLNLLLVAIALGAIVWLARRVALIYTAYVVLAVLIPLSSPSAVLALVSVPRYVSVLFPIFWPLARLAERYRAHDLIVAVFAAGLGVCTLLFVSSYYVH